MNRGHESALHREYKRRVGRRLRDLGFFLILYEQLYADIVALRIIEGVREIFAVEIQRFAKNIEENITRDLLRGADKVVVVAVGEKLRNRLERQLQENLPVESRSRVSVVEAERFLNETLNTAASNAINRSSTE